jgi:hypothetical protein
MPVVRASLAERFIFNFRLPVKALARYLPVSWLAPQEVGGYGVASFCILDLRGITVAPLTTQIGLTSISCAPRYAVLDLSLEQETPAVFVSERQTNSAFGAWFTRMGFSAPHPQVQAAISYQTTELCCASKAWTTDCSSPRPSAPPQKRHQCCSRRHRSLLISSRRASAATGCPGMVHVWQR